MSFATAAQMGADMVEFDAMLTSDGCVVLHSAPLDGVGTVFAPHPFSLS